MATSTDVTLRRNQPAQFPEKCIVCEAAPDSEVRLSANAGNPILLILFPLCLLSGWTRVSVPVCYPCKGQFRFHRWGRNLVGLALLLAALFLVRPYFDEWTGTTRNLAIIGTAVLLVLPYYFWDVVRPRYLEITASKGSITYEFADFGYALDFHMLNSKEVIKSDMPYWESWDDDGDDAYVDEDEFEELNYDRDPSDGERL